MLKILLIIGFILSTNLALATNDVPSMNDANSPSMVALNMFENTLSAIKNLREKQQITAEDIRDLIEEKLLPNIAIEISTQLTLKKYWHELNKKQKQIFQLYMIESLIKDYSSIFSSYDKFDYMKISASPNVKRKNNKAIVKFSIDFDDNQKPIDVSIKMIYLKKWRVYDVVFSGVSLIKTYGAQFNSHIKRKGIESLVDKLFKKLAKI